MSTIHKGTLCQVAKQARPQCSMAVQAAYTNDVPFNRIEINDDDRRIFVATRHGSGILLPLECVHGNPDILAH